MLVDEAIPSAEPTPAGASEATTVPPVVTDGVQLEEVLDSLPIEDDPPGLPTPPATDPSNVERGEPANGAREPAAVGGPAWSNPTW